MKISIPFEVHQKIMYWVNKADFEVSGMGSVSYDQKTNEFLIHDACLIKQEGSSSMTDIDAAALSKAQYLMRNQPGQLSFWWHSHVDMKVFMSSTDQETCKDIGRQGWCLAMVFNKRYEVKTALSFISKDNEFIHYQEDLPWAFTGGVPAEKAALYDVEYDANVSRTKPFSSVSYLGSQGDFSDGYWDRQTGKYVTWAEYDTLNKQEKKEFRRMGKAATKIDPTGKVPASLLESHQYTKEWYEEEEARAVNMDVETYRKVLQTATIAELQKLHDDINRFYEAPTERFSEFNGV